MICHMNHKIIFSYPFFYIGFSLKPSSCLHQCSVNGNYIMQSISIYICDIFIRRDFSNHLQHLHLFGQSSFPRSWWVEHWMETQCPPRLRQMQKASSMKRQERWMLGKDTLIFRDNFFSKTPSFSTELQDCYEFRFSLSRKIHIFADLPIAAQINNMSM